MKSDKNFFFLFLKKADFIKFDFFFVSLINFCFKNTHENSDKWKMEGKKFAFCLQDYTFRNFILKKALWLFKEVTSLN